MEIKSNIIDPKDLIAVLEEEMKAARYGESASRLFLIYTPQFDAWEELTDDALIFSPFTAIAVDRFGRPLRHTETPRALNTCRPCLLAISTVPTNPVSRREARRDDWRFYRGWYSVGANPPSFLRTT
eukprot:GHVU01043313.1.p2 GENE.GHVU01043313.1~~GHVU01043313.1.p2  ORF type:complete len:127 (+),score=8.72 GHVU01043313.1:815-1195(+)